MSTNQTPLKSMALEAKEFIHYGDKYLVRNLREAVVNSHRQEVVYMVRYVSLAICTRHQLVSPDFPFSSNNLTAHFQCFVFFMMFGALCMALWFVFLNLMVSIFRLGFIFDLGRSVQLLYPRFNYPFNSCNLTVQLLFVHPPEQRR